MPLVWYSQTRIQDLSDSDVCFTLFDAFFEFGQAATVHAKAKKVVEGLPSPADNDNVLKSLNDTMLEKMRSFDAITTGKEAALEFTGKCMADLTAAQGLMRQLTPGETREALVGFVLKRLPKKRFLVLGRTLETACKKLVNA